MRMIIGAVGLAVILSGCTAESPANITTANYQGPGPALKVNLYSHGVFRMTTAASAGSTDYLLDVAGTVTPQSSGFSTLGVTAVTKNGGSIPAPTTTTRYDALVVPGLLLVLPGLTAGTEPTPLAVAGTCPTAATTLNWIATTQAGTCRNSATLGACRWMGAFTWTPTRASAGTSALGTSFFFDKTAQGAGNALGTGSCEAGVVGPTSAQASLFLTAGTAATIEPATAADSTTTLLALPRQTLTFAGLAGDYAGVAYSGKDGATTLLKATLNSDGTSDATKSKSLTKTDVGGVEGTVTFAMTSSEANDPADGLFKMTLSLSDTVRGALGTGTLRCTAATALGSSSKKMVVCAGQAPTDNTAPYHLYLVSK